MQLDSDSLDIKETVSLNFQCHGITTSENTTAIGTRNSVVKFSGGLEERRYATLSDELFGTDNVALDDEDNIIYSSFAQDTVRKQNKVGNVLFTYTHLELKMPMGLAVSRNGEIFVNGHKSNNIHLLSKNGKLLRILEGVNRPTWVKYNDDTKQLFVIEAGSVLKVLEFTPP